MAKIIPRNTIQRKKAKADPNPMSNQYKIRIRETRNSVDTPLALDWVGVAKKILHEREHKHIPKAGEEEVGRYHLVLIKVKNIQKRCGRARLGKMLCPAHAWLTDPAQRETGQVSSRKFAS